MAYTIQFLKGNEEKRNRVLVYLRERLIKDGRFNCRLVGSHIATSKHDRLGMAKAVYTVPGILIEKVRLVKAKSYCGNHPGSCLASDKRKPIATYLEWDDWVAFHGIVNRVLNRFKSDANVWTLPQDVKGKFLIRQGLKARIKYDWTEEINSYGQPVHIWNTGDYSQF